MAIAGKLVGDKETRAALKKFGAAYEGELKKLTVTISSAVQREAIRSIQKGPKTGRVYKRKGGKTHQASAPGEPPATDTGDLVKSIKRIINGPVAGVGTSMQHGKHLEFGTSKVKARPWLFPALEGQRRAYEQGLRQIGGKAMRKAKVKIEV